LRGRNAKKKKTKSEQPPTRFVRKTRRPTAEAADYVAMVRKLESRTDCTEAGSGGKWLVR